MIQKLPFNNEIHNRYYKEIYDLNHRCFDDFINKLNEAKNKILIERPTSFGFIIHLEEDEGYCNATLEVHDFKTEEQLLKLKESREKSTITQKKFRLEQYQKLKEEFEGKEDD